MQIPNLMNFDFFACFISNNSRYAQYAYPFSCGFCNLRQIYTRFTWF